MKSPQFAAVAALSLFASPLVQAGVTFEFSYPADDIANSRYWYDPTYGAFARTLLKKTMDDIGEELDSDAVITCEVQSYPATGPAPGFLAGATGLSAKVIGNLNEGGEFSKILNGVDFNGPGADARFIWNFGRGFTGSNGMLAYIPYVFNHELAMSFTPLAEVALYTLGSTHFSTTRKTAPGSRTAPGLPPASTRGKPTPTATSSHSMARVTRSRTPEMSRT